MVRASQRQSTQHCHITFPSLLLVLLDGVYTRSSQNRTPNSNTSDLNSGKERSGVLCITSGTPPASVLNAGKRFQPDGGVCRCNGRSHAALCDCVWAESPQPCQNVTHGQSFPGCHILYLPVMLGQISLVLNGQLPCNQLGHLL